MAIAGRIIVDLIAKDEKWSDTISKSEKGVRKFVDNVQRDMKSLTLQNGAGAFVDVFSKGAKAAEDFATQIRTGTSNSEAFGKIIDDIPIVGKFKQAGEAIGEVIFKTKALQIESQKLSDAAEQISDAYRDVAAARSLLGLRGTAQESRQIDIDEDNKVKALHKEQEEVTKQIEEIEKHRTDLIGAGLTSKGNLTDAQNAELEKLLQQKEANNQKIILSDTQRQDKQARLEASAQRELFVVQRDWAQRIESNEMQSQEVALRRRGQVLESAQMKQEAQFLEAKHAIENEADELARPYEKSAKEFAERFKKGGELADQLESKKNADKAAGIRKAAADLLASYEKRKNETVASLQEDLGHKQEEQAIAHRETMTKIQRDADIQQLEAKGKHYEAAVAKADADYFDRIATMERKYREEHNGSDADYDDPGLKGEQQAAYAKRDADIAVANSKRVEEEQKKASEEQKKRDEQLRKDSEEFHKEQAKLWEEAKTPIEKYQDRIRELKQAMDDGVISAEQYLKLAGDASEKAAKGFGGADHALSTDPLYGRQFDFRLPGVGAFGQGSPMEEALKVAKEEAERNAAQRDNIDKLKRKVVDEPVPQIDINGVGTA